MRAPLLTVPALLAVLAPAACSADEADGRPLQDTDTFTLSADRASVYNLAGDAEIVRHEGSDVVVEVSVGGPDAARLAASVDRIGGRDVLRVIYPSERVHYSRASGRRTVDIDVESDGTFARRGWSLFGGDTRVSTTGGDLEAWADLRILVPADADLAVQIGLGDASVRDISARLETHIGSGRFQAVGAFGGLTADVGSGSIDVEDAGGDVLLDTGSGSIRARSIEGNARLDTGSGSVDAEGIRGDRLTIDTGSGTVTASDLDVVRLGVDTGSGNVRLDRIAATDIHVDTGSGSVTLGLQSDVEHLEVDTGSGNVTLQVPEAFGARLDIETGSGGIDTDLPVQLEGRPERDHLRGTVGDGRGTVRIDTGSGGVRIRPTN